MKPVYGLRREADGGIESESAVGPDDVIVNRLRHPDDRHPELMELVGDRQSPVTADHDHRIQTQLLERFDARARTVLPVGIPNPGVGEWVSTVGGSENRAPDSLDTHDVGERQLASPTTLHQAVKTVLEPNTNAAGLGCRFHDGANDGVQPGGISSTSQQPDSFRKLFHLAKYIGRPRSGLDLDHPSTSASETTKVLMYNARSDAISWT